LETIGLRSCGVFHGSYDLHLEFKWTCIHTIYCYELRGRVRFEGNRWC